MCTCVLIVCTHCCFLRLLKSSRSPAAPPPRIVPHQLTLVEVLVAMLREPLLLLWVPVRGTPSCLSQGLAIRAVACGNEVGLGEELGNVLDPNLALCSYVSFLFCLHFLLSSFLEIPGKILKCHLTGFNSDCNSCTSLPGKPWPQV